MVILTKSQRNWVKIADFLNNSIFLAHMSILGPHTVQEFFFTSICKRNIILCNPEINCGNVFYVVNRKFMMKNFRPPFQPQLTIAILMPSAIRNCMFYLVQFIIKKPSIQHCNHSLVKTHGSVGRQGVFQIDPFVFLYELLEMHLVNSLLMMIMFIAQTRQNCARRNK